MEMESPYEAKTQYCKTFCALVLIGGDSSFEASGAGTGQKTGCGACQRSNAISSAFPDANGQAQAAPLVDERRLSPTV